MLGRWQVALEKCGEQFEADGLAEEIVHAGGQAGFADMGARAGRERDEDPELGTTRGIDISRSNQLGANPQIEGFGDDGRFG